jgi:hypothetical protein
MYTNVMTLQWDIIPSSLEHMACRSESPLGIQLRPHITIIWSIRRQFFVTENESIDHHIHLFFIRLSYLQLPPPSSTMKKALNVALALCVATFSVHAMPTEEEIMSSPGIYLCENAHFQGYCYHYTTPWGVCSKLLVMILACINVLLKEYL